MLTAAGEVVDRIGGLEMGADDYLAKPVDLRELLARIKAVLRRTERATAETEADRPQAAHLARFGRFTLNLDSHKLLDGNGGDIPLTGMEFDLLKAFADNPNRLLTRHQPPNHAQNRHWESFDRSIALPHPRIPPN